MKEPINSLLKNLDESLNSTALWLCFEKENTVNFTASDFLLQILKTGEFHHALVKSDCARDFDNYVELLIENNTLKRKAFSGTTYNGESNLILNPITKADAKQYLIELLTGIGQHFSKSIYGKFVSFQEAEILINNVFQYFNPSKEDMLFYQVSPNFLWKVNDIHDDARLAQLGFFEGHHKDFVLIIQSTKSQKINLHILLTNGFG